MRLSVWIVSLVGTLVSAAPSIGPGVTPECLDVFNQYFDLLTSKVGAAKSMGNAPSCDLSKASMPQPASPLPPPSEGLKLKHVAIGRGTQNYTCANSSANPVAFGAQAVLFNASCIAANYPDVLSLLPRVALQFNIDTSGKSSLPPAGLSVSGYHYFPVLSTAFFDLDTAAMKLGQLPSMKNNSQLAPSGAPLGQNNVGYGSVPWLKLVAKPGATGGLQEAYRLNTAGGSPPPTCSGMPSAFQIQYAAEYWFWST